VRDKLFFSNHDIIRLVEPTKKSPYGIKLRQMLSSGNRPSPKEELMLFEEDRRWHMEWVVKHALLLDCIVLQDRGYFSTAAYQGSTGAFDYREIIRSNERFAFLPNATFLFDIDVDVALGRIEKERSGKSSMEKRETMQKVRDIYLKIYKEYGKSKNVHLIDASKDPATITDLVVSMIEECIKKQKGGGPVTRGDDSLYT
jgi:dTMP kinase